MAKQPTQSQRIDEILDRLAHLEKAMHGSSHTHDCKQPSDTTGMGMCRLPDVPERTFSSEMSPTRERLVRYFGKKWVSGTNLTYAFFDTPADSGDDPNVDLVRAGFKAWEELEIGISFEEVSDVNNAMVRIGFRSGDGAWSYVGRDIIDVAGRGERTMNFGWDLTTDPRGGGVDTPIHEIGHTLGFPHEHQNPFSGIVWDEDAVYRHFAGSPNFWSRATTFHNVLRKLDRDVVDGSSWDPDSIMHYAFAAGLIEEPTEYATGLNPEDGLSETDIEEVQKLYPPVDRRGFRKLRPLESEKLDLEPGDQVNFELSIERSDDYTLQTFGMSDVVMVLFEENPNEADHWQYIAGDDDSGSELNAKLQVRLKRDRRYLLRLRLYSQNDAGSTAVLMW
ncbi:M12 family metallopeptidase [Rhodopirellula bahusiensis]